METQLPFSILPQPDETTCGPTCLHAVYNYYGDSITLKEVIAQTPTLQEGGTLAVFLGCHALSRGYKATIYTYNLQVFDPTWFSDENVDLTQKLIAQASRKEEPKLKVATQGYLDFLSQGGVIRLRDLSPSLIRGYLKKAIPIITGLSATYLHRSARELSPSNEYSDIYGYPSGHFVVLHGYNKAEKTVFVAEPLLPNPISSGQYYGIRIERVICAILLGILTYDANLLIIEKPEGANGKSHNS